MNNKTIKRWIPKNQMHFHCEQRASRLRHKGQFNGKTFESIFSGRTSNKGRWLSSPQKRHFCRRAKVFRGQDDYPSLAGCGAKNWIPCKTYELALILTASRWAAGGGRDGPGCLKLRIRPIERPVGHGHVCVLSGSGHYSPLTDFMTLIRWAQIAARFSFKWRLISSAKQKNKAIAKEYS